MARGRPKAQPQPERPAAEAAPSTPDSEEPTPPAHLPPIVALGSSAGGLDALTKFFGAMPADSGMAFVIVAHLDPTHESLMAELLGRCTTMPVVEVGGDTPVESDHVYCIPPGKYLSISGRALRLSAAIGSVRMPIDFFLRSLAGASPGPVIGIILSGTGTDGTVGMREIKAAGGLAIAQDPASSEHDGMPRSAIDSGAIDHVLSPVQMPRILLEYLRHLPAQSPETAHIEPDALSHLLDVLHDRTKFDFKSYRRSTLERRIGRRMAVKSITAIADYARLVLDDPAEATALFDDLLISVTSFFRDAEAWNLLQERVIRPLVERMDAQHGLRVWVPGCATGEEAYTIAMLLIEELGAARKSSPMRVFASDADGGALEFARAGLYPGTIVADVPPDRLRRFFTDEHHAFRVTKTLRESVVFARQNLVADPPFPSLDLICCRNVIMYFEAETQRQIISLLHYSLVENGHLFLGTAETLGPEEHLFEVVSRKWRIYRRVGPARYDRVQFPRTPARESTLPVVRSGRSLNVGRLGSLALQMLVDRFVPASVLINRNHEILYVAGPMHHYLRHPTGVPTQELMSRASPGLQTKLLACVQKAAREGVRTVVTGARLRRGDAWHRVRLTAEPLRGSRELEGLLLVSFVDEPSVASPVPDAPHEHDEPLVRQLEDELTTVREDLQGSLEELQSSNQELRVANEEVMSVNEELRSSNEELETSKEELQSLNEELSTVNAEFKEKILELEQANNDLDNLLTSTNIATIFLDTAFHVRRFTPATMHLFSLIPTDVGRPIGDITQRCADPELLHDATAVLANLTSISKEIQDRDGRWFVRQVLPYRTHTNRIEGVVITYSDVAAEALQEARLYAEAVVDTVREPLLVLDADLTVQSANRSFYQTFQVTPETTVGRPVYEVADRQLDVPSLRVLVGETLRERGVVTNCEVEYHSARGGRRIMLLNARILTRGSGRPELILLALEDVTDRRRAERTLLDSAAMTRAGVQTAIDGVITIDEHATILSFNPAAEGIFGYGSDDVIGRNFEMLEAPDPEEHTGPPGGHVHVGERMGRGRRKDGTTFPCDLHGSEFDDATGRRFVVTVRDVTDRRRAEDQIRHQQGEMAHVLRVATIERFAAGLAHELNQPLAAIANDVEACATYVKAGKVAPRRLLGLLDRAGAEALRAGAIVHHLREFVQRTEPRLEVADLRDVARNATRWLVPEMEHEHIVLHLDFGKQALPVCIDSIQIEQVLVNLLQNGIDAIREAGTKTRDMWLTTSINESGLPEAVVEDTGPGVSTAATDRLYEPFFTTKPHGMGMGLAICLTIAEMHHGQLSVAPRASGAGTTVRLVLPFEGPR